MNREILFRGKSVIDGKWYYSMTVSRGTINRKKDKLFVEIGENKWKGIMPESLGQFTGLPDKNGTKIFEGDWLQFKDNGGIGVVLFIDGSFGIASYSYGFEGINSYTAFDYGTSDFKKAKVIGNIFDNPKLMEES